MKKPYHPPCGCGSRFPYPARPDCSQPDKPPCRPPGPPICAPAPDSCCGYLMQRILAAGRLHRRRGCYALCLDQLPQQAQPPYTVLDVCVCAPPQWQETPCGRPQSLPLQVRVPLTVRLRDACGQVYTVSSAIGDELILRYECPPSDCWRGQPFVQASVRLAGRACPCEAGCPCDTPLEVILEGYILAPCALNRPDRPACPPALPWYPQPIFDPYQ